MKKGHVNLMSIGDFYEAFGEDALVAAKVIGLTITRRRNDNLPMCGFPKVGAEKYIALLLRAGYTVAIKEPEPKKKVRRKTNP